jgi:ATP-dependent Lon protease
MRIGSEAPGGGPILSVGIGAMFEYGFPPPRIINRGYDDKTDLAMVRDKLEELKQSLLEVDVLLDIRLNEKIHDREVRIDNGWTVKIGRGLDFYQKPDGWFSIGASDLGLRKCLETKVDIFKQT